MNKILLSVFVAFLSFSPSAFAIDTGCYAVPSSSTSISELIEITCDDSTNPPVYTIYRPDGMKGGADFIGNGWLTPTYLEPWINLVANPIVGNYQLILFDNGNPAQVATCGTYDIVNLTECISAGGINLGLLFTLSSPLYASNYIPELFGTTFTTFGSLITIILFGIVGTLVALMGLAYGMRKIQQYITGRNDWYRNPNDYT